ncbi:MAG: CHAT domain-containing tetratricopeptide repeat protein [Thermodesulfobacteriota bacterium]
MKTILAVICWLLFVLTGQCAYSQSWESANTNFAALQAANQYQEALKTAVQALKAAQEQFGFDSTQYRQSLANMARAHQGLEQWEQSIRFSKELIRLDLGRLARADISGSTSVAMFLTSYEYLHNRRSAATAYERAGTRLGRADLIDPQLYTALRSIYSEELENQGAITVQQAYGQIGKYSGGDYSQQVENLSNILESTKNAGLEKWMTPEQKEQWQKFQAAQENPNALHPKKQPGEQSIATLAALCRKYTLQGYFSKGVESCTSLYELRKSKGLENENSHALTIYDLAYLHWLNGDIEKTIALYEEGISFWQKNGFASHVEHAKALQYLGTLLFTTQKYREAVPVLKKAAEVIAELPAGKGAGEITAVLSDGLVEPPFDKHGSYSAVLSLLASGYRYLGDYESAKNAFVRYRAYLLEQKETNTGYWMPYALNSGILYHLTKNWENADKNFLAYGTMINQMLNSSFKTVGITSEKKAALQLAGMKYSRNHLYTHALIRSEYKPGLKDEMYNFELSNKGVVIRTQKKKVEQVLTSGNPALIADFEKYLELGQKLTKLYQVPILDRRLNENALELEADRLEKKILMGLMANPKQMELVQLSWKDVQKNLGQDEAAIEFFHFQSADWAGSKWGDKVYYGALIIRPGYEHPELVSLFEAAEFQKFLNKTKTANPFEQVRRMYTWLPGKYGGRYKGDILHKLVWSPLEPHLQGVKKIYFSPDGLLHQISFNAIPVAEKKTLVSKYQLHQLTSTGILAEKGEPLYLKKEDQALLFGGILYDLDGNSLAESARQRGQKSSELFTRDQSFNFLSRGQTKRSPWPYLKGTLDEVQQIDGLLGSKGTKSQVVVKDEALEESFKKAGMDQPKIIHIATHGFFFPSAEPPKIEGRYGDKMEQQVDPDEAFKRAGLLFAGANTAWSGGVPPAGFEDGILTALEISKLNLNTTRLVVLSACETGLGDVSDGEGVYGLQRAFKLAGVDHIIMSLWQIPDAQTAELMNIFYSQWLGGKELRESFQIAQQTMSEKYEPFFWGAFVLLE